MDDRHFGYRPKTLKDPGATEAALAEHSFRRRHLRRVRSFGGFGETHGSKAHTYARASGLADLSWQAHTRRKHLCVHVCWVVVGVKWRRSTGPPRRRGNGDHDDDALEVTGKTEKLRGKQVKKLTTKGKTKKQEETTMECTHAIGSHPPILQAGVDT